MLLKAFFLSSIVISSTQAYAETYLLMAEEDGCYWCERWDEEISALYPKTAEGKLAPLQRYDLHSDEPEVAFDRRVHYTPTFILVHDGEEVGRLEGYPGEDFFWGLLARMIKNADLPKQEDGDANQL